MNSKKQFLFFILLGFGLIPGLATAWEWRGLLERGVDTVLYTSGAITSSICFYQSYKYMKVFVEFVYNEKVIAGSLQTPGDPDSVNDIEKLVGFAKTKICAKLVIPAALWAAAGIVPIGAIYYKDSIKRFLL